MLIKGNQIYDESGRILILRGCCIEGSPKSPVSSPNAASQGSDSQKNPSKVSFTGCPFPLEDAETCFKRLKNWGFTFLRFIITWEALEHEGPGIYDEEYLAYLRKIMLEAEKQGIFVFIDPRQDDWDKRTGGAPAWTLESENLESEKTENWLREKYIAAINHCKRRLKKCKAIVGWGLLNEPDSGFISRADICTNIVIEDSAMETLLSPYPMATAGTPLEINWDSKNLTFRYRFIANPEVKALTEIFVPAQLFAGNMKALIINTNNINNSNTTNNTPGSLTELLKAEIRPEDNRVFIHNEGYSGEAEIIVTPAP